MLLHQKQWFFTQQVIHIATMNDEQLREAGVSPGMIRLSVGIESAKDIINDLKEALENA